MSELSIPYGKENIQWSAPSNNVIIYTCNSLPTIENIEQNVIASLKDPINSIPLKECVQKTDKVAIIVSDSARLFPQEKVLRSVLSELSYVPISNVTIIIANGNHQCSDPASIGINKEMCQQYRVINHNSRDNESLTVVGFIPSKERKYFLKQAVKHFARSLVAMPEKIVKIILSFVKGDIESVRALIGYTALGRALCVYSASLENKIKIHRVVKDADISILIGQIKPHFLAGFSGGLKAIFPGCADITSIAKNHFMMNHPSVQLGKNENNIIRDHIEKSAEMCGKSFMVNVVMNPDKTVAGVFAGDPVFAQRLGSEQCREIGHVKTSSADIVVTSEGFPEAINLYQLIKIIPPAALIVRKGGAIICVGACSHGIGGLCVVNDITCKIGFWHLLPTDVRMYLVSDLPKSDVDKTEFIYAKTIDEALEKERSNFDSEPEITVLSGAGLMIPEVIDN
ncbi:MAG: lactate racemase domain-containing protein [Candidatus Ancaeobacter aquaticus]|nr:lactate racemase domain-containing protein [Candidatus Ancaeobacter aquaticus]